MKHRILLFALGLAAAVPLALLATLGDLAARAPLMLVLWGGAHTIYLFASWLAVRGRAPGGGTGEPPRAGALPWGPVLVILAVGLIPRLALLTAPPSLSGDLYRYLWDGRLVAHGVNPYPLAPADRGLASLRDGLFPRLNHASVPTVYPPAAQILFAGAAVLGATPLAWKLLLFLLETALVAVLISLLRRLRLHPERLLLYYWNPLVIVECYGSGHVDLAAAALLLAAIYLQETGRRTTAGLYFGAAIVTKWVPLLLVPALLRRRAWSVLAWAALLVAVLYAPFLPAGASLVEGLRIYARHWEFNGPLYAMLRPLFRTGDSPRLILAAGLAVATLGIAWRARSLSGAALATWAAFLVFSPTVYPWYLVPAVALLPLHPDAGLLLFSGTVALTYAPLLAYRATGVWRLPGWIMVVEYGTWAAVSAGAWWLSRRRRGAGADPLLRAPRGVHHGDQADVEEPGHVEEEKREGREQAGVGQGEHGPREVQAH
jgi:hypothetical protein